ncbi:hypothetical protein SDC9_162475 [bioreactor metagenome]|uniref:Uncharacterized protein n=1 Tax=bioreactor metagenome TaxID=1076179 RepID=A0A645FN91_9ZZZZ
MFDKRNFAMNGFRSPHHLSAKYLSDGLMSQANSQNRGYPCKSFNDLEADSGIIRRSRTRRYNNGGIVFDSNFFNSDLIIADDFNRIA